MMNPDADTKLVIPIRPIGVIRTPFATAAGTPIQSLYGLDIKGEVLVEKEYEAALTDIEGFERLWLIYWFDRAAPFKPKLVPYRDDREHGALATRAPCRPNPIGMSLVRLLGRDTTTLYVTDIDILDNTPLIDIKPYVPAFDVQVPSLAGWFDHCGVDCRIADQRFHERDNPPGGSSGGKSVSRD
jgi:tRNA (adenine37-N6)-methyltransferase